MCLGTVPVRRSKYTLLLLFNLIFRHPLVGYRRRRIWDPLYWEPCAKIFCRFRDDVFSADGINFIFTRIPGWSYCTRHRSVMWRSLLCVWLPLSSKSVLYSRKAHSSFGNRWTMYTCCCFDFLCFAKERRRYLPPLSGIAGLSFDSPFLSLSVLSFFCIWSILFTFCQKLLKRVLLRGNAY